MQDDGYVRPTRAAHFGTELEENLLKTIVAELQFLGTEKFVDDTTFDDSTVDFSYVPEETPPDTIRLNELSIGHNDALASITGIERGYYI